MDRIIYPNNALTKTNQQQFTHSRYSRDDLLAHLSAFNFNDPNISDEPGNPLQKLVIELRGHIDVDNDNDPILNRLLDIASACTARMRPVHAQIIYNAFPTSKEAEIYLENNGDLYRSHVVDAAKQQGRPLAAYIIALGLLLSLANSHFINKDDANNVKQQAIFYLQISAEQGYEPAQLLLKEHLSENPSTDRLNKLMYAPRKW